MLIPVLALAMMEASNHDLGSWLYHECKATVRWMDASEEVKLKEYDKDLNTCIDYFFGYMDALSDDITCIGHASLGTLLRVYVAYMDAHPKLMDQPRWVGANLAFVDAYPCPAK